MGPELHVQVFPQLLVPEMTAEQQEADADRREDGGAARWLALWTEAWANARQHCAWLTCGGDAIGCGTDLICGT
jgi:hypothetical protein